MSLLREAMLYEQLPDNKVVCNLCGRRCTVPEGALGFCRVRKNERGRLYSLVYAKAISACVDPITKKPLSHFHPGSSVMSIATIGCNFRCKFCLDGEVLLPFIADRKLKLTKAKELDLLFQKNQEFVNVADRNLHILGFTGLKKIIAVSRRKADDVMCELVTERGKSVRLTEDHRVMVWNENEPRARRGGEIKVGDKVRTGVDFSLNTDKIARLNLVSELADKVPTEFLRYIYVSNIKPVLNRIKRENRLTFTAISSKLGIKHNARRFSLGIMPIAYFAKLVKLFGISDDELLDARITVRGSPYRIPVILPLTPRLMRLLGYFVAEGNYSSGYNLALTNKDEALLEDMRRCILNTFNTFITESRPKGRTPQLIFGGKLIHLTFKHVFEIPVGSTNTKIPDIAFNVDKILLKEFLSGYMTGDGILCQRKNRDEVWIRFVTASNLLKTQLCFLLNMNGIQYSVRMLEHFSSPSSGWTGVIKEWRIDVYGCGNLKRLNEIAVFLDERQRIVESYPKTVNPPNEPVKNFEVIKEIKRVKPTHVYVYDITLEGHGNWEDHAFFVNEGVLIHNCDNWVISQEREIKGHPFPPEEVVKATKNNGCQGISYTYTEPTIFFEYAYDTAKMAHKEGIFNTFVTNGYMTPEAVRAVAPVLDAATVDFKGGGDPEFYKKFSAVPSVDPIYESLREMKKHGIHVEITNLVVPKVGDSIERVRELATWTRDNLGRDAPLHLLRFHPDYQLTEFSTTPISTLEKACDASREIGLNYVYIGNVPGHRYENTYCPNCREMVIKRFSFEIVKWNLTKDMRCPACGQSIAIKGQFYPGGFSYPYALM